jgi:hypothetical protein
MCLTKDFHLIKVGYLISGTQTKQKVCLVMWHIVLAGYKQPCEHKVQLCIYFWADVSLDYYL